MKISLERGSSTPVYLQIVYQIREQILTGQLSAGYRLPPERQLALNLEVNRTTVLNAYRELKAEGLIGSHVGRGTVVLDGSNLDSPLPNAVKEPMWEHLQSEYAVRLNNTVISDILEMANRRDVISFAAGIGSPQCRPDAALQGVQEAFLDGPDHKALLVSPVEGFSSLREAVAAYLRRRGCHCHTGEVMMLSGSQQGIDLAARILLSPGDVVVVEEPSFFPALNTFRAAGARLMGVPMGPTGMDLDVLEQLLLRYRPKLIYTIPSHHNPCGVTMPLDQRIRLVELAYRFRTVILEDDAYGELCYDSPALPTLKSMDPAGFVIYLNTFSKTVYPGLRLGFTVAHRKLIHRFAAARQLVDLHTNCLSQQIIERFLTSGALDTHLEDINHQYKRRRDRMLDALECHAPSDMQWSRPAGGYYIWCALPPDISGAELARLASSKGVAFLPGSAFFLNPAQGDRFLRLNFTFPEADDIPRGIAILCNCIREIRQASHNHPTPPAVELNPIL